ncbi:hypothetical protein DICVIV_07696 [Dictyocaulus viviparus]|uniref:Uncharacterized protein n=1 Tax=Dictyocaulus viviparus TaxID=29172 RepID=A0A0D8XP19_DICVI|nr:hypothetical protein DICVIV_07696 [Dictyocaulus viviparus]
MSTNPEKSVVPQSSSNSKVQSEIDFLTEYGYQSKAIRCFVAHEIAFQLVFGHAEGTKPSCYELFPPSESFSSWQVRTVEDLTVYVDEESPLRFLPPLPPFKDVQRYFSQDKKVVRQLEHIMLTNCALGLMAMAPNPDVKLFSSPRASMFFVSRKAVLHDTSTSGRGYASVTLPLSSYDKYNYLFNRIVSSTFIKSYYRIYNNLLKLFFDDAFLISQIL